MRNRRKDGTRIKEVDGFHSIVPYVMPKRTEAEASMTEIFDVTELCKFMKEHNEKNGTDYKLFHAICYAVARTIYHRPKLNIFISGRTYYMRNDITLSFVVKRKFEDHSEESLIFMKVEPNMTLDKVSQMILGDVEKVRSLPTNNDLDKLMSTVGKLPRPILECLFGAIKLMEYNGVVPAAIRKDDPNYSTVLLSNLGSIGAGAAYHHLSNYGTCSLMGTIGTMRNELRMRSDGTTEERTLVDMTITLDERIADGFYFAKSLRITKFLLENPEYLLQEIREEVPVSLR